MSENIAPTPERALSDWMASNDVTLTGATPAMLVSVLRSAAARALALEWEVRAPEDRGINDGWMSNNEAGSMYLRDKFGYEVRRRTVSEWAAL